MVASKSPVRTNRHHARDVRRVMGLLVLHMRQSISASTRRSMSGTACAEARFALREPSIGTRHRMSASFLQAWRRRRSASPSGARETRLPSATKHNAGLKSSTEAKFTRSGLPPPGVSFLPKYRVLPIEQRDTAFDLNSASPRCHDRFVELDAHNCLIALSPLKRLSGAVACSGKDSDAAHGLR